MKFTYFIIILFTSFIISCNNPKIEFDNSDLLKINQDSLNLLKRDSFLRSKSDFFNNYCDSFEYLSTPKDTFLDTTGILVYPSTFHGDEVDMNIKNYELFGIFEDKNKNYFLKKCKINIENVKDEIIDENGEKSGKEVKVIGIKDKCLFIIGNITNLSERKINLVQTLSDTFSLYNMKPINFINQNNNISIYSEYESLTNLNGEKEIITSTLKVFIINNITHIKQLLYFMPCNDEGTSIDFIGDIDGDNIPDLILNTSNHYNVYQPTLFLSSFAEKDKIYRIMAFHFSSGC